MNRNNKDFTIILGSSSERRKMLLSLLFNNLLILKPECEEKIFSSPIKTVIENSKVKIQALIGSKEFIELRNNELKKNKNSSIFVITADTIVFKKNKIYPKPKSKEDAFFILKDLNGKKHSVYSGVCLYNLKKLYFFYEKTDVYFNFFSDNVLKNYIETVEPYDAAGAYKIQGSGAILVKKVKGSITNVIGFPVEKFLKYYNKFICYSNEEVSIVSTTY